MRRRLIWLWVGLLPMALGLHLTLGRQWAAHDTAIARAAHADTALRANDWVKAEQDYRAAIDSLLAQDNQNRLRRRLRLALEHCRIRNGHISDALTRLIELRSEAERDTVADQELLTELRAEIAESQYYAAWLLRRAGADAAAWMPLAESARQDFRYLAGSTHSLQSNDTNRNRQNMATVVEFTQRDDASLHNLPFPDPAVDVKQDLMLQAPRSPTSGQNTSDHRDRMNSSGQGSAGSLTNTTKQKGS